jgi:hypothetical protein
MDLAIIEDGNGGDLKIVGNDFASQNGWGNMVYLAMFGGNVEASTRPLSPTQLDFSYWGNAVLYPQNESVQFNSRTERALKETALNSAGRIRIQQEIEADLKFMEAFARVTVRVTIEGVDRISIVIRVQEIDPQSGTTPDQFRAFVFIWDATRQELGDFRIQDFNEDFFI